MLEKIEKLQLVWLAVILALGLIFAVKTGTANVTKDKISVTGSAYQVVNLIQQDLNLKLLQENLINKLHIMLLKLKYLL